MKFFTKRLPAMMVVLSVAAVVLTGCGNVSNVNGAVTAKIVVEQSVAAMEKMMAQPTPASQANVIGPHYSVVMPNSKVDDASTRKGMIMASSMPMYMAEYFALNNILEEGKIYKDYSPEDPSGVKSEFIFCMENMNDGVKIKVIQDQNDNTVLYFYYDYNSMQPTKSICAQWSGDMIVVILFDYKTNEVMELCFEAEYPLTLKSYLNEKKLSFTNFSTFGFTSYEIAKLDTETNILEVYKYQKYVEDNDKLTDDVDEQKVEDLFNSVYEQVKEHLVEPEKLNTASAESKTFFERMMWYARYESYTLAGLQLPEGMPETMPE